MSSPSDSSFESLAKYHPLQNGNPESLPIEQALRIEYEDLAFSTVPKMDDSKEFYNFNMTTKDGKPLVFTLRGTELSLGVNKMNQKLEFKLNLNSNGMAQHLLARLCQFLEEHVARTFQQDIKVKSPMYQWSASLPWCHSYGKYNDIEAKSRQVQFSCNPQHNLDGLERLIQANSQGEFDVRVVLKSWIMREKEIGTLKAGYKLHVQKVVAL